MSNNFCVIREAVEKGKERSVGQLLANFDINETLNQTSLLHVAAKSASSNMVYFLIISGACVNAVNSDGETPLAVACKARKNDNVKMLLKNKANAHIRSKSGNSPLHFAAQFCNCDVIELLLKENISVNITDSDSRTPLMWACYEKNNDKNVEKLLEKGADVKITNNRKVSPLHLTAQFSDHNVIGILLRRNISVNVTDDENRTPLMWACYEKNNIKNVEVLLANSARLDKKTTSGASVLHLAAKFSDSRIIERLVLARISVNIVDDHMKTPLIWACESKNEDNVKILLKHCASVNISSSKYSPLHFAAQFSIKNVIDILLREGILVNCVDEDQRTPLMWACYCKKNERNVKALLTNSADVNVVCVNDVSSLHLAAKFSDKKVISILLKAGISVDITDVNNKTPLIWACEAKNNEENVVTLLENHADVQLKDNNNNSPLHFAAQFSDPAVIRTLLEKRINVNVKDNEGRTPLMWACYAKDNDSNVSFLLANNASICAMRHTDISPLHLAAAYSDCRVIDVLLCNGLAVNVADSEQRTPLIWACFSKNNLPNVEHLLDRGASINAKSEKKIGLLHFAAKHADDQIITFLLNKGLLVNMTDNENRTPLLWACYNRNNEKNVKCLLEHKADVNITNKSKCSPLHFAAQFSDKNVITALIKKGISVNVLDDNDKSPLMWACFEKINAFLNVSELLEEGADVHQVSKDNITALHIAAEHSDSSVIKLLLDKGISVNILDGEMRTPLMWACFSENNKDNVKILVKNNAQVDVKDAFNNTPLHFAAAWSNTDVIDYLMHILPEQMSVNAKNDFLESPLTWACKVNCLQNVKHLVTCGAKMHITPNADVSSLLHVAARCADGEMLDYFIQNGISIDVKDEYSSTPIFSACEENNENNVKKLLELGAAVNIQTVEGLSLLHVAAACGSNKLLTYLLEQGLDVHITDKENRTPLSWACEAAKPGNGLILINSGAEFNPEDLKTIEKLKSFKNNYDLDKRCKSVISCLWPSSRHRITDENQMKNHAANTQYR